MQDLKAYKRAREDLLFDLLGAAGLVGSLLPPEVREGSKFARAGGSQWTNHDLKIIANKLQDVLCRYDQVQHALGLREHDARFGHGPPGSTNEAVTPGESTPENAAGRKSGRARKKPR